MSALLSNPDKKAELVLNTLAVKKYLKEKGWTLLDLSQQMGISYNMLHLVMKGKRNPGNVFIAGILATCKEGTFEQFFTVIEEKRQTRGVQAV
jgi:lambda repressor-like predicted transcriptional regulator